MPVEGLPTIPIVVFWSGDIAYLIREVPIVKGGKRFLRLYMILDDFTVWRYKIKPSDLDFTISEYGVYIKEYPAEYFERLTGNPENPVLLAFCNFDGTFTLDNIIAQLKDKIVRLQDEVNTLRNENEQIREKLKEAIEYIKVLEETE
jgi:hypothetical protein